MNIVMAVILINESICTIIIFYGIEVNSETNILTQQHIETFCPITCQL